MIYLVFYFEWKVIQLLERLLIITFSKLFLIGTIDFVEFMTYIPFFVQLHEAVINTSVFDEERTKDKEALEKEFKKSIRKHNR